MRGLTTPRWTSEACPATCPEDWESARYAQSGMDVTRQLLALEDRPTAIFALNDLMALGALQAAAWAHYSVPGDLAVVGYDDLELARFTIPPLTSISRPMKQITQEAVNLLAERMAGNSRQPSCPVLAPELIVRCSTQVDI
ncbi:MAG TPA: substrate-binding domain-containing protein [Ramlibacter sp.]|nr:substrate-binding domain-containing protein [Ramlibacter sp.]